MWICLPTQISRSTFRPFRYNVFKVPQHFLPIYTTHLQAPTPPLLNLQLLAPRNISCVWQIETRYASQRSRLSNAHLSPVSPTSHLISFTVDLSQLHHAMPHVPPSPPPNRLKSHSTTVLSVPLYSQSPVGSNATPATPHDWPHVSRRAWALPGVADEVGYRSEFDLADEEEVTEADPPERGDTAVGLLGTGTTTCELKVLASIMWMCECSC